MAISVPVKACYGMPMLYFVIHGLGMLIEKGLAQRGFNFSQYKLLGRIWVILWLVLPMPVLFPKPFIKEVLWPLLLL